MEKRKHHKHPPLTKPTGGRFHREEWTVIGAPCSILKSFTSELTTKLTAQHIKVGFIDMTHQPSESEGPYHMTWLDKIGKQSIEVNAEIGDLGYRKYFSSLDLLFVNGNHFKGKQQIVFVNEGKKDSLQRKMDRLNDIKMFILDDGQEVLHDFLKPLHKEEIPVFKISEMEEICAALMNTYESKLPPLKGLVLSGGKSMRMGEDKSIINYHGKPQSLHMAEVLSEFCTETFLSVASDKEALTGVMTIMDAFVGLGPYGGILSAFKSDPNAAWLTVACDQPYLDANTLRQLVDARDRSKVATCFYNPDTDFPEPLITIWEPRAYSVLLDFLSQGYSCPRKVLINSEVKLLEMKEAFRMDNANTPEEKKVVLDYIADKVKNKLV